MKKILIFLFLSFITFSLLAKEQKEIEYNTIKKEGITFSWRINDNTMDIKLSASTKGWISVGFDPRFKMKDADFILAYVENGKVFIIDGYGTSPVSHMADIEIGGEDNVANAIGYEKENYTEISFSIPLNSKDKFDKKLDKGKHLVLLAYSSIDNINSKHKIRTSVEIEIY